MNTLTEHDMKCLQHMLGVSTHIKKRDWGYRNYFAAGANQIEGMERLLAAGYVNKGHVSENMTYYHATEAGMDAIGISNAAKKRARGD